MFTSILFQFMFIFHQQNAFPVCFFTPNDRTMANLFEEIKLHIGKTKSFCCPISLALHHISLIAICTYLSIKILEHRLDLRFCMNIQHQYQASISICINIIMIVRGISKGDRVSILPKHATLIIDFPPTLKIKLLRRK